MFVQAPIYVCTKDSCLSPSLKAAGACCVKPGVRTRLGRAFFEGLYRAYVGGMSGYIRGSSGYVGVCKDVQGSGYIFFPTFCRLRRSKRSAIRDCMLVSRRVLGRWGLVG